MRSLIHLSCLLFFTLPSFAATVTLSWDPPTTNADGTPLTDLKGYYLYYGTTSGYYSNKVNAGDVTSYAVAVSEGIRHYFAVTAYDTSGNESYASNEVNTVVQPPVDTYPPVINLIMVTNIRADSAAVTWSTDEPATSQVDYGLTASLGSLTPLDSSLVMSHSAALTGLSPSTKYYFRVKSKDAAGNEAASLNYTFTTTSGGADTEPPVISGLTAIQSGRKVYVMWNTNEPATSQLEYGPTSSYGTLTPVDDSLSTSHTVTLTGLSRSATYNFRARSKDAAGNEAVSANYTFSTKKGRGKSSKH